MKKKAKVEQKVPSFSIRLILLLVVLAFVGLLLVASLLGGKFGVPHQLALDFIGPVQGVVARAAGGLRSLKDEYLDLRAAREEAKRLRVLADTYLAELTQYREGYANYRHLEELLAFKKRSQFPLLAARVVGREPVFWYQTIIVDRGRSDDVLEGMVAMAPAGAVGQVIHVGEHYSKVLLANAPSSAIDAMVQKNRIRGILKGAAERGFVLNYVLKNADVEVGDTIVTAGIGGVFPTGIPLGKVSSVVKKRRGLFQEITVVPEVDFQTLEFVFIDLTDRRGIMQSMGLFTER